VTYGFMVSYPLLSMEGRTANATSWSNVGTWTPLYNLPGRTGFTAHHIKLSDANRNLPIASAAFRLVFQSANAVIPSARLYSLHYAPGSTVGDYDYEWGTFTRRSQFNPDNQTINVTDKLRTWLEGGVRLSPQLGLEVNGSGVIHEATLEITYSVPDFESQIESLADRIAALEAGSLPAPSQPDDGLMEIAVPAEGLNLRFVRA
jgi:hypothetical protein